MQSKKNILVTGACGQLGREIQSAAAGSRHNYIFTDLPQTDISDSGQIERLVNENHVSVIVNCAAYTAVDAAEDNPLDAERINHTAVDAMARVCLRSGATLIHISTDYVFDGAGNTPLTETSPTSPRSVYGRTKLAGEAAIVKSGCRHIILRTAWLYSRHGDNFVKKILRRYNQGAALKVVFDQTGTPTWAADLAGFICSIVENGACQNNNGIYHFSNEGVCSWFDLACESVAATGGDPSKIAPCLSGEFTVKAQRPAYSVLDKTKITSTFGINIPHWRISLGKCIKQILE